MDTDFEDMFKGLGFDKPNNLIQIRAWYEVYKDLNTKHTLNEILLKIGVSEKKINSFKTKLNKGFNEKELNQVKDYLNNNITFIRAILFNFQI